MDVKAASAAFVHSRPMHMYSDLAPWFHLLTHPSDYWDEAAFVTRVVDEVAIGEARTLLELGSGGGNNASHLKARFDCTLTDISPDMLALSRTLNPECEHLEGDMRTLRLGRTFDVVFIHDAIIVPDDRGRPARRDRDCGDPRSTGGVVILTPDATTRDLQPATPTTAGTTAKTGAACATSSGRTPATGRRHVRRRLPDHRSRSRRRAARRPRPAHARSLPARRPGRD